MDKSISRESAIKLAMESYQQGKIDAWSSIKQTLVGLARQQDNIDLSKTVAGIDFVIHEKEVNPSEFKSVTEVSEDD